MSTPPNDSHGIQAEQDDTSQGPEQIEADIAKHRQELGNTVDELTERLDVKKQAQLKVESVKTRASTGLHEARARLQSDDHRDVLSVLAPVAGAVAAVVLIIGVVRWARR